jgi:hypothetical protein
MESAGARVDFDSLARDLLGRARELLPAWFPNGRTRGSEFIVGNLDGDKGESLSVSLTTGKWSDFAFPDFKGGDLISLWAAKRGISQVEAARELGAEYARLPAPTAPRRGTDPKAGEKWTPVLPVPDDAPKPHNRRMVCYGALLLLCYAASA